MDKANKNFKDVNRVIKDIVPLVDPNNIEVSGWDISNLNLY